jgi:hypothetical protein
MRYIYGGDEAAQRKQNQAQNDDALAAVAVGGHAVGDLQYSLRQAVGAQGNAHQGVVVAAFEVHRMHREHRQNQEQTQHAQRKNRCKRKTCTNFQG